MATTGTAKASTQCAKPVDGPSVYHPLGRDRREIRVLKVTSPDSNPIECDMDIMSLDDDPEYRALSYCWGPEAATRTILLDGVLFPVRPNLHDFLQVAQAELVGSWIFIDAICINQRDPTEVSSQVGMMGEVYRSAIEVIAWVGSIKTPPFRMSEMLAVFDEAAHILRSSPTAAGDGDSVYGVEGPRERLLERFEWSDLLSNAKEVLRAPYWTRLWVVQELMVARRATVYCGPLRVDCWVLAQCFDAVDAAIYREENETGPGGYEDFARNRGPRHDRGEELLRQKRIWHDRGPALQFSLSSAVIAFSRFECSLRQDKIFALLGLASSTIRPDYGMSLVDLYIHSLVEGDMEIWQDTTQLRRLPWDRITRTRDFHHGMTTALNFDATEAVSVLITDTVLAMFGHRFEFSLEPSKSDILITESPLDSNSARLEEASRIGIARLSLRQRNPLSLPFSVPAANGARHFVNERELVRRIEATYEEVLERKFQGCTNFATIAAQIDELATGKLPLDPSLGTAIASFPTPKEAVELLLGANRAMAYALNQDTVTSSQRAQSLQFWESITMSFSKRFQGLGSIHHDNLSQAIDDLPPEVVSWLAE